MARLLPLLLGEAERGRVLEQIALARLAEAADGEAAPLARELRAAIGRSGLFYEAHLRAWIADEFAIEDLRREPQNRLASRLAVTLEEARAQPDAIRAAPARPSAAPAEPPVPPELQRLVREQLTTLETRTAVFPLLLWPGQEALLAIREEPFARNEPADGASERRRCGGARLALNLPRLGQVRLALTVQDESVHVSVSAATAEARTELAARSPELRGALHRNALALERLEVSGHAA